MTCPVLSTAAKGQQIYHEHRFYWSGKTYNNPSMNQEVNIYQTTCIKFSSQPPSQLSFAVHFVWFSTYLVCISDFIAHPTNPFQNLPLRWIASYTQSPHICLFGMYSNNTVSMMSLYYICVQLCHNIGRHSFYTQLHNIHFTHLLLATALFSSTKSTDLILPPSVYETLNFLPLEWEKYWGSCWSLYCRWIVLLSSVLLISTNNPELSSKLYTTLFCASVYLTPEVHGDYSTIQSKNIAYIVLKFDGEIIYRWLSVYFQITLMDGGFRQPCLLRNHFHSCVLLRILYMLIMPIHSWIPNLLALVETSS